MKIIKFLIYIKLLYLLKQNIKVNIKIKIKIVNKFRIKTLNNRYREKNKITDILTFKEVDFFCFFIHFDYIKKMEINKILLHGILHLVGYDHNYIRDDKIMNFIGIKIGMSGIEPPTITTSK